MGKRLMQLLVLVCDSPECQRTDSVEHPLWKGAVELAEVSGWILHADGQAFCSRVCDQHYKPRPSKFLRRRRKQGKGAGGDVHSEASES